MALPVQHRKLFNRSGRRGNGLSPGLAPPTTPHGCRRRCRCGGRPIMNLSAPS